MSLHDHVAGSLPALQAEAERMMADRIRFTVEVSAGAFDPVTGMHGAATLDVVYDGRCQVQIPQAQPRDLVAGDDQTVVDRVVVKVPIGATEVPVGAVGEITAVGPVSDPALVGQRFRVVGGFAKTFASARRLPCERVEGG